MVDSISSRQQALSGMLYLIACLPIATGFIFVNSFNHAFNRQTFGRAEKFVVSSFQISEDLKEVSTSSTSTVTTPETRSAIARLTWETVGFSSHKDIHEEVIQLNDPNRVIVYNEDLFQEFKTLTGTYFINGLSTCRIGDRIMHPFEAHGYVKSLALDGSGECLKFKSAIVGTPLTKLERQLNVPLARGVMSTLGLAIRNALTPSDRNTANLSATLWPPPESGSSKKPILIVAGDNGMPYVIDPESMTTIGPLSNYFLELKGKKLLAHSRIDEKRQRLILCGCTFDIQSPATPAKTIVEFYEYDVNFQLQSRRAYQSDRFMFVHDWMITDNYYVVPKNPATFKWSALPKFVLGLSTGTSIFEMDTSSVGQFVLVPRHSTADPVIECPTNSHFTTFHFGPCYEEMAGSNDQNNVVTIHASVFDKYQFGGEMGYNRAGSDANDGMDPINWSASGEASAPRLDKFVFDTINGLMLERQRISVIDKSSQLDSPSPSTQTSGSGPLVDVPVDMPTFREDGVPCRYSYFLGAARPEGWFPFRSVVKTDLATKQSWNWDAGDDKVTAEPIFVPKQQKQLSKSDPIDEDDGFVLSIIHDSTKKLCELVIWDSKTFNKGPIGRINLGNLTPWNVHGSWVPFYVPSDQKIIS